MLGESTELMQAVYDPALVLLSMLVATIASYVSLDVAARIWSAKGVQRSFWIGAAAVSMGGGIWAMHFIAMLAFSLPVQISYDFGLTFLSLSIAILVTGVAFTMVSNAQRHRWRLLPAGVLMGLGVAAMHYTGMAAMQAPAVLDYTPGLLIASVAIACVAATAALWIATCEAGLWWRAGASLVMAGAISGMHYTGMAAACFSSSDGVPLDFEAAGFQRGTLAAIIAVGAVLILFLGLASAAVDRRFSAFRDRETELMRLSARRFQKLVQSSNDMIVVVDRTGAIQFVAQSSVTAIGIDPADLRNQNILELLQGEGVETLASILRAEEASAAFAFVDQLVFVSSSGERRDYEVTACNLIDEPAVGGIALTFHDVTERERSLSELRRAKQIADEANRLKGDFIARMNHELRTPLNAILGFSEVMVRDTKERYQGAEYRAYAADIHSAGQQLLTIVNDILDFSKAEVGSLRLHEGDVSLVDLVAQCVRTVLPIAEAKGVDLRNETADDCPWIRADEQRMRQVLLNLLSNAIKFTPEGGAVTVSAGSRSDGAVEVAVRDTGVGMISDELPRITEPFYQINSSSIHAQEGTGLGLAISKSLIELHNGDLRFESRKGVGTCASIALPVDRVQGAAQRVVGVAQRVDN